MNKKDDRTIFHYFSKFLLCPVVWLTASITDLQLDWPFLVVFLVAIFILIFFLFKKYRGAFDEFSSDVLAESEW